MNNVDEKLVERLVSRIEQLNTDILKKIGKTIGEIKNLTPTQAHQLEKILKYGQNYNDIVKELSKVSNVNVDEINQIFNAYAKQDYDFAKDFYNYKGLTYKSYKEFSLLNQQVKALSKMAVNDYLQISKTKALGFTITDLDGKVKFKQLKEAYQYAIDQAVLSISQGKDTFDSQMFNILKGYGSGLKVMDYDNGRARRLDSVIRMHLSDSLRNLHNATQEIIGQDFGSDGVEISVHEYPAPDHEDLQGKQFSINQYDKNGKLIVQGEFEKLQENKPAKDYNGRLYSHDHRPISELNCYHTTFAIVLGVSKPQYTDEQLQQIKERNEKGFELDGKHYTMYQGTQLQRKLETAIRKQKDTQILAKESDNKQLIADSQSKITQLTTKYKQLSKASGLSMKQDRLRVSGYKRTKIKIEKDNIKTYEEWQDYFANKYGKFNAIEGIQKWDGEGTPLVEIKESFKNVDKELMSQQFNQFEKLRDKYNIPQDKGFTFDIKDDKYIEKKYAGGTDGTNIIYNEKFFKENEQWLEKEKNKELIGDHTKVSDKDKKIYITTHEFGHILERQLAKENNIEYDDFNLDFMYDVYDKVRDKTGIINIEKIKDKYVSNYGKKNIHEDFAETFVKYELGEKDEITKAFEEMLKKYKIIK